MKPTKFTPELGEKIVALLQAYNAQKITFMVCGGVVMRKGDWAYEGWDCHRYANAELLNIKHPDIMGFAYQGVRSAGGGVRMTDTGREYLRCLVDPSGPFAGVLPYLYHEDVDEIIEDGGFVVHSMSDKKFNAGLFWTFIQATRLLFEFPEYAPKFEYLVKYFKDPAQALFATMAFQPVKAGAFDKDWGQIIPGHCSPLGYQPKLRAKGFLSRTVTHVDKHSTSGSSVCFGGHHATYPYGSEPTQRKPLDQWAEEVMCFG